MPVTLCRELRLHAATPCRAVLQLQQPYRGQEGAVTVPAALLHAAPTAWP